MASEERLKITIGELREFGIKKLGASHCTGMLASAKLFHEVYLIPEENIQYYPRGIDLIKKYEDKDIAFITGRDREYNFYTKRSLDHVFEENGLDISYTIYLFPSDIRISILYLHW
jgi:hypothetical protein